MKSLAHAGLFVFPWAVDYPARRQKGNGAIFVRQTAKLYFEMLQIGRLFCEPTP